MKKNSFKLILFFLVTLCLFFLRMQEIKAQTPPIGLPTIGLPELPLTYDCGQEYTDKNGVLNFCNCENKDPMGSRSVGGNLEFDWCCGWYYDGDCQAIEPTPTPSPTGGVGPIIIPPVDSGTLDNLNPLKQFSSKGDQLSTPGGIISEILTLAFPIAGIILFVMLVMAGLKMLTGATNSSSLEEGKKIISTAIIGFIILFAAYWIAQLLEIIFGVNILGN